MIFSLLCRLCWETRLPWKIACLPSPNRSVRHILVRVMGGDARGYMALIRAHQNYVSLLKCWTDRFASGSPILARRYGFARVDLFNEALLRIGKMPWRDADHQRQNHGWQMERDMKKKKEQSFRFSLATMMTAI
jgi:hypothetical protein